MTSARSPAIEPENPAWTELLTAELDRRIGLEVDAMRGNGADLALKSLVISDAEVDGLLAPGLDDADGRLPGSLAAWVLEAGGGAAQRLVRLRQRFALDGFQLDTVLVCLAPLIERRFERLFAYLNDDLGRPFPSVDLLLRLLAPRSRRVQLRDALDADAPLLRWGLLLNEGARGDLFRLADGVARHLLGRGSVDPRVAAVRHDADVAPLARQLWQAHAPDTPLAELLRRHMAAASALLVSVHGRAGSGRAHVVEAACAAAGVGCLALDGRKLRRQADWPATLVAALRDACLAGKALFLHHADPLLDEAERQGELRGHLQTWLRELGGIVLLGCEAPQPLGNWFPALETAEVALPVPTMAVRESAWESALAAVTNLPDAERAALAQTLASKFRMTLGEIASAAQQARAASRMAGADADTGRLLHEVVSRVTAPRLHQLAEAMPASHSLDDIVLPADKLDLLRDLVRRVKHRRTVLEDWRFDAVSTRGRGLVALFHGVSGTGKTMAADALAHTLRMRLFRIDLAGVVSKYIGETEKNLRAIFDEAARADAVLFFDEADALFGKRSEVKDAHDRYANIEINYLLQRIESFDGIAILATNKRSHIDDAFLRRIHVTIEFPLPRVPERLRLWDRSFPEAAPMAQDIDWPFLAQHFELSGGAIRNAALGAAYLAAEESPVIGMRQVVNALRNELVKAGRRPQDGEFGAHAHLLARPSSSPTPFAPRARPAFTED